ncbi:hypothetical protein B0I35DRAFT_483419 [Stachybotrys elegans]|uniref:Uncharacterized protein n=1 Tax=Stachybotrys elegans TaxID=80388 RepID=A0A8K0SCE4_9HYPO|nr:hypothetical protein B0I35DRAFT_483419 [Stachybotrys elegans]
MSKRKERRESSPRPLSSSSNSTAGYSQVRPTTPSSPVQIPNTSNATRNAAHPQKRHAAHRKKAPRDAHTPESISPSLVALLAVTDIPRPRRSVRRKRQQPESMVLTLDDIISRQQISEKELSWTLTKGPLDVLLTPPEDLDDLFSMTDSNVGSVMSTRTGSADSIPTLGNSFTTDLVSSIETPSSPPSSIISRRSRISPMRKSLEPVRSPPDTATEHPLAAEVMVLDEDEDDDEDELSLKEHFEKRSASTDRQTSIGAFKPLRAAFFKSNLTASLRALRSAAKSFSAINFSSLPSDDFLTRSILTMDSRVPYMDERRPPLSQEMPSAELRRYLNPTTSSLFENQPAVSASSFSASIQMQTYKVQRSRSTSSSNRNSPYVQFQAPSTSPEEPSQKASPASPSPAPPPGMRQREMRENSDFIRIAVMEMAMRKRGKLDDQQPGRARWALPPRKMSVKPYEIGADGVPVRWIPISH